MSLSEIDPRVAAKAACLRYLTQREYSRAELLQKLRNKGYDETVAHEAVNALGEDGLQDDGRCAASLTRGRVARGQGPLRIRQAMRAKGLGEDAASSLADYDWDALIADVYTRKYGSSRPANPKEYAARVRFLNQRGFNASQIGALLRRLRQTNDFEDLETD